jgi:hypothetical protein
MLHEIISLRIIIYKYGPSRNFADCAKNFCCQQTFGDIPSLYLYYHFYNTATNHLWKPTFAKTMVSINGNGSSLNGYVFPLNGNGFPLHGNFDQNFKSWFQPKNWNKFLIIFEFFLKLHVQGSIIL